MRGCAYAGGNGFYLFAKANLSGQVVCVLCLSWLPLDCGAVCARAHCRFAPEYRLRAHRPTAKLVSGFKNLSSEQEVWVG